MRQIALPKSISLAFYYIIADLNAILMATYIPKGRVGNVVHSAGELTPCAPFYRIYFIVKSLKTKWKKEKKEEL